MTDDRSADSGRLLVGRYRVHEILGQGGMSTVHRATDDLLGLDVAVKRMHLDTHADPGRHAAAAQRLLREARIAASLRGHPHVITVHDLVTVRPDGEGSADELWLVMEHYPSSSLAVLLGRLGPIPVDSATVLASQLADALAAAHARGIVHRDVKPDNVLIADRPELQAKLLDFGISRTTADTMITQAGQIVGTPAYLAPEIARGRPADARSDAWSLGATLYTALEGHAPFDQDHISTGRPSDPVDLFALLGRIAGGDVPAPVRAGPLTTLLSGLLDPDPASRLTAAQASVALRTGAGSPVPGPLHRWSDRSGPPESVAHADPATPPERASGSASGSRTDPRSPDRPGSATRRRRRLLIGGGAVLLAGAVALGVLLWPDPPATTPADTPTGAAAPVVGLGPERVADPCSLMSVEVLADQPGDTTFDRDNTALAQCRIDLRAGGDDVVSVLVDLERAGEAGAYVSAGSQVEQRGAITVVRYPRVTGGMRCVQRLAFADGSTVRIQVEQYGPSTVQGLCRLADRTTDYAVERLNGAGIGTRVSMELVTPLATVDACALLSGADLGALPSLAGVAGQPGVADWYCSWRGDGRTGPSLVETYLRRTPADDPVPSPRTYGGRAGQLIPEDGSCTARVIARSGPTPDADDPGRTNVLWDYTSVVVSGPQDSDQLCTWAAALGDAAAPRLPS